jgi:Iron-containing redox enzyme
MTTSLVAPQMDTASSIKLQIENSIDDLMASLPNPKDLTPEQRRGIIARYSSVLEGNFIYWMTATYMSVQSSDAHPILLDNLREEIGDCHPAMLRRFAIAAHAFPTDKDALAINDDLNRVRMYLGRLQGVENLITMGFFEGFIQKFMAYLADLAVTQGSTDMEYADVHGVCDIAHSQGLFVALSSEMSLNPPEPGTDIFKGVALLTDLIQNIVHDRTAKHLAN